MRRALLTLAVFGVFGGVVALRAQGQAAGGGIPPAWAYPQTPASFKQAADPAPRKVPGGMSTRAQARNIGRSA